MPLSGFHRHFLIPSIIVIAMAGIGCYFLESIIIVIYDYNNSHYWFICDQRISLCQTCGF